MKNYEHSGVVPPLGLLIALAAGGVSALALGFIYAYAIAYIPLIYVNFLLTLGYGFALGFAVAIAAYWGKLRNVLVACALGFLVGLIGVYVEWAVSLPAIAGWEMGFAFHPLKLLAYGQLLYENGSWGIGGGQVKGIMLAVVWLIEAGMIVGMATFVASTAIADHPFCESCRDWTDKVDDVQRLAVLEGQGELVERLATGDLTVLDKFARAPKSIKAYIQLDMASCKTCSNSCFVTASMVVETVDSDGDLKKEETPLLKNYTVHESDLELVRNAGHELNDAEKEQLFGEADEMGDLQLDGVNRAPTENVTEPPNIREG